MTEGMSSTSPAAVASSGQPKEGLMTHINRRKALAVVAAAPLPQPWPPFRRSPAARRIRKALCFRQEITP
jgi:hypothetical protein